MRHQFNFFKKLNFLRQRSAQSFQIMAPLLLAFLFLLTPALPGHSKIQPESDTTKSPKQPSIQLAKKSSAVRLRRRANLRFGKFGSNGPNGMIVINPNTGLKTVSGGVFDFGGIHSRAKFRIRGKQNSYVIVTLPSSITVSVGNGSLSMTVQNFTMNITNPVFLGPTGLVNFFVGATAVVGASQQGGKYHGSFTVNAEYQ